MDSYHEQRILGNLGRIACNKEKKLKKYEKYLTENLQGRVLTCNEFIFYKNML